MATKGFLRVILYFCTIIHINLCTGRKCGKKQLKDNYSFPEGVKSDYSLSLTHHCHTHSCLVTELCLTLQTQRTIAGQAPLSMDFPGKNTGAGCHALLLTQRSKLSLLHWQADASLLSHLGSPCRQFPIPKFRTQHCTKNTVTKLPVTLNAEVVLTPDGLPEENSLTLNSWAVRFSASTRVKTQAPASISDVTVMPNLWGPPLTTVSSPAKPYPPASRRYKLTTFSFTEKSPMQCPHLHIYFHSNNME